MKFFFSLSSYKPKMDKGKQCYKYYSSNVREPLEINTILCSKVGVVWMSSPTNGNLSGLTLGATSLTLGSRDVHVQSFDHVTSSHLKWWAYCQILAFLTALIDTLSCRYLKVKPILEMPEWIKPLLLKTGWLKPTWLWTW